MPEIRGRLTLDVAEGSSAPTGAPDWLIRVEYIRTNTFIVGETDSSTETADSAEGSTQPNVRENAITMTANNGEFTLFLRDPVVEEESIILIVRSPESVEVIREVLDNYAALESRLSSGLTVSPTTKLELDSKDIDQEQPQSLNGRVIRIGGSIVGDRNRVVIFAKRTEDIQAEIIFTSVTDEKGYFSGPYPTGEFNTAWAWIDDQDNETIDVDPRHEATDNPIILEAGKIPSNLILGVPAKRSTSKTEKEEGCISISRARRTLEEFDFHMVVRTSEPEIKGFTLEDTQLQTSQSNQFEIEKELEDAQNQTDTRDEGRTETSSQMDARGGGRVESQSKTIPRDGGRIETPSQLDTRGGGRDYRALFQTGNIRGRRRPPGRAHLTADNPADWDDTPTFYQAVTIAHGHLLTFKQSWKADGFSIGDLLYSLPLAPCQSKQIVTVDWERREMASRTELTSESEKLASTLSRDRDISEIVMGTLRERSRGGSASKTSSFAGGLGIAHIGDKVSGTLGISGGKSKASSSSWQKSSRNLAARSQQSLLDTTTQSAAAVRSKRSTVITTATQGETVGVETEVVTNHNHCHAMTIEYFEVLRHFEIVTTLVEVQECLFVPLLMNQFDAAKALRWRDILEYIVPDRLRKGFAAMQRIADNYVHSDFPTGTYAEEDLVFLEGEMWLRLDIVRPPDPEEDGELDEGWHTLASLIGEGGADSIYKKYQDRQDHIFANEVAAAIARTFVESLYVNLGTTDGGVVESKLEVTLVSNYKAVSRYGKRAQRGPKVFVKFNPGDISSQSIKRESIRYIYIENPTSEISDNSRAIIESASFRYRTEHYEGTLYSNRRIYDDLLASPPQAILPVFLSRDERRNPRNEDIEIRDELIAHLNANIEAYHRLIWLNMDPERRYMLLDGFLAPGGEGKSVASVVENRLIGIVGNSLILPVAPGFILDPGLKNAKRTTTNPDGSIREMEIDERESAEELLSLYKPLTPPPTSRFSIPTKGVFAEAKMGNCNSCEEIDDSRFWRWSEEPCGDTPTPIEPVGTGSRRSTPASTEPSAFSAPIINLQNAPNAPDPTGLASALQTIANANAFRDMAGLSQTQKNAIQSLQTAFSTAQSFGETAAAMAMSKQSPQQTRRKVQEVKSARDAGLLNEDQAKSLTQAAFTGGAPLPQSDVESTSKKLDQINRVHQQGGISQQQKEELNRKALERMVDDGAVNNSLVNNPNVSNILQSAKSTGAEVNIQDGAQAVQISASVPTSLTSDAETSFVPSNNNTVVVDGIEYNVSPNIMVRNWANNEVEQFPYRESVRSINNISGIVLHETATVIPWSKAQKREMLKRPPIGKLGIHGFFDYDGTLIQHNDFVDELIHGNQYNSHTIGFEIIAPMSTAILNHEFFPSDHKGDYDIIDVTWGPPEWNGQYVVPPRRQLEAIAILIWWLMNDTVSPLPSIPRAWPAYDPNSQEMLIVSGNNPVLFGGNRAPGIIAHGQYRANKYDGLFPLVYCWLSIEAGFSSEDAFFEAKQLLSSANLITGSTHIDLSPYTPGQTPSLPTINASIEVPDDGSIPV